MIDDGILPASVRVTDIPLVLLNSLDQYQRFHPMQGSFGRSPSQGSVALSRDDSGKAGRRRAFSIGNRQSAI